MLSPKAGTLFLAAGIHSDLATSNFYLFRGTKTSKTLDFVRGDEVTHSLAA